MSKAPPLKIAFDAARDKQAQEPVALHVKEVCSFADTFLILTAANRRQSQAISDEIEMRMKRAGLRPIHIEGYNQAEWILMDYVDLVIHIFSPKARVYYDLDRLWRAAPRLALAGAD